MINSKTFFEHINFDFDEELKPMEIAFDGNPSLSQKTIGNTFRYTPLNERLSQKGSLLFYIFKPPISDQVWRLGKFYDFG
jgi:hypothetical protein